MFESRPGKSAGLYQATTGTKLDHSNYVYHCDVTTYDIVEEDGKNRNTGFTSECEKEVYEIQLLQLQEQLEAAMIEKEQLAKKLKKFSEDSFRRLEDELKAEKRKNKDLQLMITSKKHSDFILHSSTEATSTTDLKRMGSESKKKGKAEHRSSKTSAIQEKKGNLPTRIMERVVRSLYDIADDFSPDTPVESSEEEKDKQVNITILKENVKRFSTAIKPYISTIKGIKSLFHWETSAYTLVVFMVYMYAVWQGRAVQLFLLCLIFRHFISYLQSLGIKIKFNFLDREEVNKTKKEEPPLGLSDKINVVVEVAKKVQDFLGKAADSLEKIESVLTWRYRPAAQRVFLGLCGCLVMSAVMDFDLLLCIMGLNMGIKLFLVDYIYYKFPRVKRRYDSVYRLWKALPTKEEWQKTHIQSQIDKYVLSDANKENEDHSTNTASGEESPEPHTEADLSAEDKSFCQLFCLPSSEVPLQGWRGGRRCTLVNKEKRGIGAFKNGKLYLTKSFLCFERKRSPTKENLLIPLVDVEAVNKAKPYQFMLGTGMAIEVMVKDKSFIFGGILSRDDAYNSIQQHGINNELPWATGIPLDESPSPRLDIVRLTENKQNFSFPAEYSDFD
ncbi:GRAM domain-containing protein 4-like [Saccostrea cucullata]|uniref:GRAM domain-containing protein 4-like n=1 Tax=Saccostrea cuccullata TaxID=36930 RepID=UPI002ED297F3